MTRSRLSQAAPCMSALRPLFLSFGLKRRSLLPPFRSTGVMMGEMCSILKC